MVYDSMAAWDRHGFQFNDNIQSRGKVWQGDIAFSSDRGKTISRDDYLPPSPPASSNAAPSFNEAKSHWSPPPSPRSRSFRESPSSSYSNSPRIDSPTSMESPTLIPKTGKELHALAAKLYAASCAGDLKHIRLLLSLGASVNTPTLVDGLYEAFKPAKPGYLSSLAGAAGHGQLAAVKLLLSNGAVLNPTMKQSSSSPLHQACKSDDAQMAAYLLSVGADVNILNCFNTSPTMYAGKYASPETLSVILTYEPDLHRLSFINTAAIHWSLWPGNEENIELLLQAGADVNHAMGDGSTPLHCAAFGNYPGVARLLLAYGADPGRRNEEWKTAVQVAREVGSWGVVDVLEEAEEVVTAEKRRRRP